MIIVILKGISEFLFDEEVYCFLGKLRVLY